MSPAFKVGPYRQVQWRNTDPALTWVLIHAQSFTDYFIDSSQVHPDNMISMQVSSSFYGFSQNTYSYIIAVGLSFRLPLVSSIDLPH